MTRSFSFNSEQSRQEEKACVCNKRIVELNEVVASDETIVEEKFRQEEVREGELGKVRLGWPLKKCEVGIRKELQKSCGEKLKCEFVHWMVESDFEESCVTGAEKVFLYRNRENLTGWKETCSRPPINNRVEPVVSFCQPDTNYNPWEEGTPVDELLPSDWPVHSLWGHFLP